MADDAQENLRMALTRTATGQQLEVALVCFGQQYVTPAHFQQWLQQHNWKLACIVNNQKATVMPGQIAGSNTAFEFSGYAEALPHFTSQGPFLLINDTFFHNHSAWGWTKLLKRLTSKLASEAAFSSQGVWGDIRREQKDFPEKDKEFLASWFFFLPDRPSLLAFQKCLERLLTEPMPTAGPAYAAYVDAWLQSRSLWSGWHGHLDEVAMTRKRTVIRMEHRLSQLLKAETALHGVDEYIAWFPLLRLTERLYTRFLALRNKRRNDATSR